MMVEGMAFNIKSLAFVNGSNGDLIKERQKKPSMELWKV